jgi:hypothetical protein
MRYVRELTVTQSDYYVAEVLDDWLEYGPRGMRVAEQTLHEHTEFAFRELYLRRVARMKEDTVTRRNRSLVRRALGAVARVCRRP